MSEDTFLILMLVIAGIAIVTSMIDSFIDRYR